MYWGTYLSDQTNTQTAISVKAYGQNASLDTMNRYNMK